MSQPAKQARKKYYTRASQGLCAYCGKTPVLRRRVCKPCVQKQTIYNERRVFKKYGVAFPDELK